MVPPPSEVAFSTTFELATPVASAGHSCSGQILPREANGVPSTSNSPDAVHSADLVPLVPYPAAHLIGFASSPNLLFKEIDTSPSHTVVLHTFPSEGCAHRTSCVVPGLETYSHLYRSVLQYTF